MNDNDSDVVCLTDSEDEDDIKEITKVSHFGDGEEEEEEEKLIIIPKKPELTDNRVEFQNDADANEGLMILQEKRKSNDYQECESTVKQDMTTQTEEDYSKNQSNYSDSQNDSTIISSGNRNITSTVSNREENLRNDLNMNDTRLSNNNVTPYCNNGQHQDDSKVYNTIPVRHNPQRIWNPMRKYGNNRVQPYNRPGQGGQQNSGQQNRNNNFSNNYNYFGIPSMHYNNFNRQSLSVRERYIEQFKDYLQTTFANFLNNILPFNMPIGYNPAQDNGNNFTQGNNNNVPQDNNNCPQGINNYPRGNHTNFQYN